MEKEEDINEMPKGCRVERVYKNDQNDPYFFVKLENRNKPLRVFYGRDSWYLSAGKKDTRAPYMRDQWISDAEEVPTAWSIDINGSSEEIIKFLNIAYGGGHGGVLPHRLMYCGRRLSEEDQYLLVGGVVSFGLRGMLRDRLKLHGVLNPLTNR